MSFMDYMGYRNMITETKIEECLRQVHAGETEISIEPEDLTTDELVYLEREVNRRLNRSIIRNSCIP